MTEAILKEAREAFSRLEATARTGDSHAIEYELSDLQETARQLQLKLRKARSK